MEDKYRHELKYIINTSQQAMYSSILDGMLKKDVHLKDKSYHIRSIYFDDYYHSCLKDNINGTDPREKFRIRIYDVNDNLIRLELKKKCKLMTQKLQCAMTREQVEKVIAGEPLTNFNELSPLLKMFELQRKCRLLKPDIIVDYDRVPYVCKDGNVRITFDMNVSSSTDFSDFFNKKMYLRPILPNDMLILEVKYDEFLPKYISDSFNLKSMKRTSFSKYYISKTHS